MVNMESTIVDVIGAKRRRGDGADQAQLIQESLSEHSGRVASALQDQELHPDQDRVVRRRTGVLEEWDEGMGGGSNDV